MEGRNVSRGIGSGAAQVYSSTQNAVNTYARNLAQQQAKRDAEQKALADKLSQFNTEGLRDVDKEGFYKVYDGWKNKSYEAMKAKDPKERYRLQAEAEKDRQKASKYVFDSKAKTQRDLAMGTKKLGKPHFFSKEGDELYNKSIAAPIYSKDDIVDYSAVPLGYDKSKAVENINKLHEGLYKSVGKYDEVEGVVKKAGDLTVAEFAKIKRVSPDAQIKGYEMLYRSDDGVKALIEESYPQLDWDNNEQQAMQMAFADMVTKSPLVKDEGVERRTVPKPDNWKEKMNYADMLRDGNRKSGANVGDYTVETNVRLEGEVPTDEVWGLAIEGAKKPNSALFLEKSVGFDSDSFPIIKAEGMDIASQKIIDNISGNFVIGKLAYVKIVGKQTPEIRAIVINSKGKKFAVNPKSLPIGIRKSKNYETAISALGDPPTKIVKGTYAGLDKEGNPIWK